MFFSLYRTRTTHTLGNPARHMETPPPHTSTPNRKSSSPNRRYSKTQETGFTRQDFFGTMCHSWLPSGYPAKQNGNRTRTSLAVRPSVPRTKSHHGVFIAPSSSINFVIINLFYFSRRVRRPQTADRIEDSPPNRRTNALPTMAPAAWLRAASHVFLFEIPNPINRGFLSPMALIRLK